MQGTRRGNTKFVWTLSGKVKDRSGGTGGKDVKGAATTRGGIRNGITTVINTTVPQTHKREEEFEREGRWRERTRVKKGEKGRKKPTGKIAQCQWRIPEPGLKESRNQDVVENRVGECPPCRTRGKNQTSWGGSGRMITNVPHMKGWASNRKSQGREKTEGKKESRHSSKKKN